MNSQGQYTSIIQPENDDEFVRPPPAPRQAIFAPSKDRKWMLASILGWTLLMLLVKKWCDFLSSGPGFAVGVLVVVTIVYAMFCCVPLGLRDYQLLRRQRLFSHGVGTVATVTFVGVIRLPNTGNPTFCIAVRWSYTVDGIECTGVTPRGELPNAVVGDRFWVLYEEGNPWYARRWALFDTDGNLRSNDELPWKEELDLAVCPAD